MNTNLDIAKSKSVENYLSRRESIMNIAIVTKKWSDESLYGLKLDSMVFPKLIDEFPRSAFYIIADNEDLQHLHVSSHILFIGNKFMTTPCNRKETINMGNFTLMGYFDSNLSFSMYGLQFSMFVIQSLIDVTESNTIPN